MSGPSNHTFINDCTTVFNLPKARVLEDDAKRINMDDDILEQYRLEAAAAMEVEAKRRIAETSDVEQDEILRNTSLDDVDDFVPALLARLGKLELLWTAMVEVFQYRVLQRMKMATISSWDLTGACLSIMQSCARHIARVKSDLEKMRKLKKLVSVQVCSTHLTILVENLFWLTVKWISFEGI